LHPQPYAAWEEGLTLGFEVPGLQGSEREASRLQKQVTRTEYEGQDRRVEINYTSLQGHMAIQQLIRRGGVYLIDSQGRPQTLLPEAFPDGAASWETATHRFTLLGRARWEQDKPVFPDTQSREGAWIEGAPLRPGGTRIRAFLLPGMGEVESRELREGRWVVTNRLVSRGFSEIPRPREAK